MYSITNKTTTRWLPIFELISLDTGRELFSFIGLNISFNQEAINAAREYVCLFLQPENNTKLLFANTLDIIKSTLTKKDYIRLKKYDKLIYKNNDAQLTYIPVWVLNYRRLINSWGLKIPLAPLRLEKERITQLQQLFHNFYESYSSIIKNVENAELLLKDEASVQWKDCPGYIYENYGNPYAWLLNQITFIHGIKLWKSIYRLLSNEEISELEIWGNEQNKLYGLEQLPIKIVYFPNTYYQLLELYEI